MELDSVTADISVVAARPSKPAAASRKINFMVGLFLDEDRHSMPDNLTPAINFNYDATQNGPKQIYCQVL